MIWKNRIKMGNQLATLALISITYFVVVIVALHFLRPDHNPIKQTTSQYVVGPYGILMTTAFFSISLASFALVVGINLGISSSARSRIGLGLMSIWVISALIAMIFPINLEGTPITTSGIVHRINGPLGFLCLALGAVLVSRAFKKDENWRPLYRPAFIIACLMLAMTMVTSVNIVTELGYAGLSQRILLVLFLIWILLTAVHLHAISRKGNAEPD
jgi:hypothetical protein